MKLYDWPGRGLKKGLDFLFPGTEMILMYFDIGMMRGCTPGGSRNLALREGFSRKGFWSSKTN